jgi:hypothetical protein
VKSAAELSEKASLGRSLSFAGRSTTNYFSESFCAAIQGIHFSLAGCDAGGHEEEIVCPFDRSDVQTLGRRSF